MPIQNYFDTVFGVNGDLTSVPDALDPSGYVSYDQGYPIGYEITPGDPGSLPIERAKMNYLFNQLTMAVQQYQQHGTPPFINSTMNGGSAYSYSKYDRALYLGITYQSLEDSNTDTPPSSKWLSSDPVEILKRAYPVGSVYINYSDSTNPATLLGFGTWGSLQNNFLIGAGGTYSAGSTGGATTHTLTASEAPVLSYTIAGFPSATGTSTGLYITNVQATNSSPTTTATGSITTNAGGAAHSILNPYVAVYMWRRSA